MEPYSGPDQFDIVTHEVKHLDGIAVDEYGWYDSQRLRRTVALKKEGHGNPGHGGYAVRMTYQVTEGGGTRTIVADGAAEGFGYFVSHERYRYFADGDYDTIARKVFGTDDAPLGRDFPVEGMSILAPDGTWAAHRFSMTYAHYGTIEPIPKNGSGEDVRPTPVEKEKLKNYPMPITITWVFEAGTDFPGIDTVVDLSGVGAPDLVNFDVRGPYGALVFDDAVDAIVDRVMWGDRLHFEITSTPATRNSSWVWNMPNEGSRYTALIAGQYEMGLFEPTPYGSTALRHAYSDGRGKTSVLVRCWWMRGPIVGCRDGRSAILLLA